MKAWLVVNKSSAYLAPKFLTQFQTSGKAINIDFSLVYIEDLVVKTNSTGPINIFHQMAPIDKPDLIISYVTHDSFHAIDNLRYLEALGIPLVNSADATLFSNNKWLSALQLKKHNVASPDTLLINRHTDINFIATIVNFPIVMKSIYGYGGQGVLCLMSAAELIDQFHFMSQYNPEFSALLQEYIGERKAEDLRVVVLNDEVLCTVIRKGKPGGFKANYSLGGTIEKFETTPKIAELAIQAAKSHGLIFGGIDLLFDRNEVFKVGEVNSAPGGLGRHEAISELYNIDFLKIILEYIKQHIKN